jgi:uncharacterized membrane protein
MLDAIWLTTMFKRFYKIHLGYYLDSFRIIPTVAFYLIYSFGVTLFIVFPLNIFIKTGYLTIFYLGAIFGFVNYSTYNLVNNATLSKWSTKAALVDIAWGTFATGLACSISSYICRFFI